jgi:hypothetical protein
LKFSSPANQNGYNQQAKQKSSGFQYNEMQSDKRTSGLPGAVMRVQQLQVGSSWQAGT